MTTTLGRIKSGDVLLVGSAIERLPAVINGLYRHYPLDGTTSAYIPSEIRYIRDWLNGNSINIYGHWVEIQAIDYDGTNVALGKSGTSSIGTFDPLVTNGVTSTYPYFGVGTGLQWEWVQVDLGDVYSIASIQIWHYYGDGRTYHGTKTEVSTDGVTWWSIFDSAVEGEYVETSSGKTHTLSALGSTVNSITNVGLEYESDTLVIQKTTSNMVTNGDFSNGTANWTLINPGLGNAVHTATTLYGKPCLYTDVGYYTTSSHYAYSIGTVSSGTTYTVSFKIYGISGNVFFDPNGVWNTSYNITPSFGKWDTYQYTFTAGSTGWEEFNFYAPSGSRSKYYITDLQLEASPYATTFTPSNRTLAGRIDYPFKLVPPYTINLWHRPMVPLSYISDQPTSPMILQMNTYYANASISLWNYVKALRLYVKGNTSAGWTGNTTHYTYTANTWDSIEHMYTVVAVNSTTFTVYMDGNYVGQNVSSEPVTNISYISMGNSYQPNAKYHDLSIYSRALSADDIKKNYKGMMRITSSGNLMTDKIVEETPAMPDDVNYFPMAVESANKSQNITPKLEQYNPRAWGSTWIGESVTNMYSQVLPSTPDANVVVTEYGLTEAGYKIYRATKSSTAALLSYSSARLYISPITANANYTLSFRAKSLTNADITARIYAHWGGSAYTPQLVEKLEDGWYKFVGTYTINATGVNCGVAFVGDSNPFDILYTEVQLESKAFYTHFTPTSRPITRVNYDAAISANNWQEFTFSMWVKYTSSSSWRLSGAWPRWYFGASTNDGLRFSWMDGVQKTIDTAGSLIQKHTWYNIAVTVKSGIEIAIYLNGTMVGYRNSDVNLTTVGDDFGLNGNTPLGTTYPLNGYVRDVILSDRAMTQQEIKSLYTVQARAYTDVFQIMGTIKENKIL